MAVCFAWIYFRAPDVETANVFVFNIFQKWFINPGEFLLFLTPSLLIMSSAFVWLEIIGRRWEFPLAFETKTFLTKNKTARYTLYLFMVFSIVLLYPNEAKSFIYFQF
jgi:hypothetical protein